MPSHMKMCVVLLFLRVSCREELPAVSSGHPRQVDKGFRLTPQKNMFCSFVLTNILGFYEVQKQLLFIDGPQKDKGNFFIAKAICCKKVFLFLCVCSITLVASMKRPSTYHKIPNECFRSISHQYQ